MMMNFKSFPLRSILTKTISYKLSTPSLTTSYVKGKQFKNPVEVSAGQVLLKMTQKHPDKIALYCYEQNKTMTYQQLTDYAVRLAVGLKKNYQLQPKDRIGVYSLNRWEWYVLQLAAAFADLILVNINPSYRSQQLSYTIQKVRVKILFISDTFKNSNYINILKQTVPELKNPQIDPYLIKSHKFEYFHSIVRFNEPSDTTKIKGFVNFTDLLHQKYSLDNLPLPDVHDAANIQFTSGTTGRPKAATLTHYNILNNGLLIGQRCSYTGKDNICVPVPLYHCFGMVMGNLAALTRGAAVTYICQGFDPIRTLQAVSKYSCTSLYGVPTMFTEYIRTYQQNPQKYKINSLRTGIIAGSLAPQALMNKILNVLNLKQITNCYGMTQTSPVSFQTSPSDTFINKTTTVGTVLDGLQAKLIDSNGNTCPIGVPGEFLLKGWSVMPGYWQDPSANDKSIVDGWMKSGDLAVMNSQGYLTIVGRSKDMIIRGGQNVYPKQVQEYLNNKLDNVLDVQVVGVNDDKYGEQIVAVIKVKDINHNAIDRKHILDVCKGHIAHYKIPKYVLFVQQYPLTVTGKIQKFILRNQAQDMKKNGQLQKYAIK